MSNCNKHLCASILIVFAVWGNCIATAIAQDAKWKAVKLKKTPQSYGSLTGNDSVTVVGNFQDGSSTYTVLEEKDKFVKISDGTQSGWVFKISVERVASTVPPAPAEPDLEKRTEATQRDPLLNTKVFWKDTAVAKVGNEVLDKYKYLSWPELVEDIDGEWLWLGRAWVQRSQVMTLNEAFDYSVEEVRRNPMSARAWNHRAVCWYKKGELANAIKDYDEAIRLDPKYATAFNNRGIDKRSLQDFLGAIKDYDEAIRLDPKYARAYNNRGGAKRSLKDFAGAITDYDEAIRLDPKYVNAYNTRGWTRLLQKDYKNAMVDFDEAIRLDPKGVNAYNNKSIIRSCAPLETQRDATQAIKLADDALAFDRSNGYSANAKACASALAGDFEAAIQWQRTAMQNADWINDETIVGGKRAEERIARWQSKQLWLLPE